MTVYTPPKIEHSEWDQESERTRIFAITRPATAADVAARELEISEAAERGDETTTPELVIGEPHEVWYTIPSKPHVGLGLRFLKISRHQGANVALSWLLEEAVGAEGYDALAAEPDTSPEALSAIMFHVRDVVLGGLEVPKG